MPSDNRNLGQATVPCKWCRLPTTYLGTRECDPCHELRVRISRDPTRARQILAAVDEDNAKARA